MLRLAVAGLGYVAREVHLPLPDGTLVLTPKQTHHAVVRTLLEDRSGG